MTKGFTSKPITATETLYSDMARELQHTLSPATREEKRQTDRQTDRQKERERVSGGGGKKAHLKVCRMRRLLL